MTSLLQRIKKTSDQGKKSFAVLIDPDKIASEEQLKVLIEKCEQNAVDFLFVGGSLLNAQTVDWTVQIIKQHTLIPVILFPGDCSQLTNHADAILYLSLLSGRNPEYLIGQQVKAALPLSQSSLEIIPTAYCLIESGVTTSVEYVSNTRPIPRTKIDIALSTAMAGQLLGMQLVYLEAGSGAQYPVPSSMVQEIKQKLSIPIIVGGGINSPQKAVDALEAGADLIVIGNGIEKNPNLMVEVFSIIQEMNN